MSWFKGMVSRGGCAIISAMTLHLLQHARGRGFGVYQKPGFRDLCQMEGFHLVLTWEILVPA